MYIYKINIYYTYKFSDLFYTECGTNNAPFYYEIFYYKIISMYFCNITISHSSTPYDIVGEMFKLKL